MKRCVILIAIACFILSVTSFTNSGNAYGKTLFQKLSDSIAKMGKASPRRRQTTWTGTSIFQKVKKNISTWDNGSSRAKALSLRGNKAELGKRRGL